MSGRLSNLAAEAVIWALICDVAKQHKDHLREVLTSRMGSDAAAVKAVANGVTVGRATWVESKDTLAVTDQSAFMQYVGEKRPEELITTVNPAYQKALLSNLKVIDGEVIDRDGEPVPGVSLRSSAPYVSVRKSDEARATVESLLSSGRLQLDGITHPELEGDQ